MSAGIFKYYRITTLNLNTLKNGQIYLTHPSAFNDPFDSIINARANDDEILKDISNFLISEDPDNGSYYDNDSLQIQWGAWKDDDPNQAITPHFTDSLKSFASDMPRQFIKYKEYVQTSDSVNLTHLKRYLKIIDLLGICSFSKVFDSESMWAYYADNHRGICVEFDIDMSRVKTPLYFDDVVYVDGDEYVDMEKSSDDDILARCGIKKKCWKNENEVRLIHPHKNNVCIAFPGSIKSIAFGAFTSTHDIELIQNVFQAQKVSFYKMRVDYGGKKILRSSLEKLF